MPPRTTAVRASAPTAASSSNCESDHDQELTEAFSDEFARSELGPDWHSTSYGAYFVKDGRLCTSRPRNHPLWLKRRLPTNVRVTFEAIPMTPNGDVKAEIFGDGCAFDVAGRDYLSTSYVAVAGAHNNAEHWLARLYEHAPDARRSVLVNDAATLANGKLVQGKAYQVELARTDGRQLTFSVDGVVLHTFEDASPLAGKGHDHFAFNAWENQVCFDHLKVTPLP